VQLEIKQAGRDSQYAPASPAAGLDRPRIGELLVDEGLITRKQLAEALKLQGEKGGKLAEILITLHYLDPHALVNFLARQPGVASIDLQHYVVPRELIDLIPKELALKHEVFPIDRLGRLLTLAMAFPLDRRAIGEIEVATGLRIKALLCSASDIRAAVQRYYPYDPFPASTPTSDTPQTTEAIHSAARLRSAAQLVRRLRGLPALPETVYRVRQAMSNAEASVRDVAELIATDPPVAAKVLSVANSAAYGFQQQVKTIELAVSLLGLRETYSIVTSAAIIDLFDRGKRFDYRGFWADAMGCAASARLVVTSLGHPIPGAVAAALLHDIGRVALLEVAPNLYTNVPPHLQGRELLAAEERFVGLTHSEAGYELAQHWEFPAEIAEAIRFHHDPELAPEHQATVAAVSLAVALARAESNTFMPADPLLEALQPGMEILGLDEAAVNALLTDVQASGLTCRWWAERWDQLRRSGVLK
jgi:HD-like signal output (HDOD) protein